MKDEDLRRRSQTDDVSEVADTRGRILEAAVAEFAEHGLAGARVDGIAERAQVNKALLYYYYGSKSRLYEETLTTYLRDTVSAIRLRLEATRTLEEALMAVADHYRRVFLSRPEIPRLILRSP